MQDQTWILCKRILTTVASLLRHFSPLTNFYLFVHHVLESHVNLFPLITTHQDSSLAPPFATLPSPLRSQETEVTYLPIRAGLNVLAELIPGMSHSLLRESKWENCHHPLQHWASTCSHPVPQETHSKVQKQAWLPWRRMQKQVGLTCSLKLYEAQDRTPRLE